VLAKLVNLWAASRIDEVMPWAWGAADCRAGKGCCVTIDPTAVGSNFLAS
jgi:hypothetical protein